MSYDSLKDTVKHIQRVQVLGNKYIQKLWFNLLMHDKSKTEYPEKEVFDEFTPKLKDCTYGSDEYKGYLKSMNVALKHHYENNSHHPEYHGKIQNMPLWDITEMLIDWIGASERHDDGNIGRSIMMNAERFSYSHELKWILINTVMGMFKYTVWIGAVDGTFGLYYGDSVYDFQTMIKKDKEICEYQDVLINGYYGKFHDEKYNYTYENRKIQIDGCIDIEWKVN